MAASSDPTDEHIDAHPNEFDLGTRIWVSRATKELMIAQNGLYASITRESIHEDSQDVDDTAPARDTDVPDDLPQSEAVRDQNLSGYRDLSAVFEWVIDWDDALSFNRDAYLSLIAESAQSFAAQVEAGIIAHISDIADAIGNVINVRGGDVVDAFLDSMEQMEFSFKSNGEPNLTLLLHPDQVRKLSGLRMNAIQQARHDEIIARKRERWNASKRRRELPGVGD